MSNKGSFDIKQYKQEQQGLNNDSNLSNRAQEENETIQKQGVNSKYEQALTDSN